MLTILTSIWFVYLIIWPVHGQFTDADVPACLKQTTYSLKNSDSLKIALYYDVDPGLVDFEFVQSMCKARETITKVTFELYPGVGTKLNNNKLECDNADENNKDCTASYVAACASKIVGDFPSYVCCTASGKGASDCVKAQNKDKVEEFNQCTQLKHPTIHPDQILLDNAEAADNVESTPCVPKVTFNGTLDPCARYVFAEDPLKVICAMLAQNTDDGCKQQN